MVFYIDPEPAAVDDPDAGDDLPPLSDELLARHGARVLSRTEAVVAVGGTPRSTVYRSATLLIPDLVYREAATRRFLDEVFNRLNLRLVGPEPNPYDEQPREARPPVLVVLEPRDPNRIANVDAWEVLQRIRDAAADDEDRRRLVDTIAVEHLMFATFNLDGKPWDTNSAQGKPWDTNSGSGASSYVSGPSGGPVPVSLAVVPAKPANRDSDGFDRRPVVAVLDTGIGAHPWYNVPSGTDVRDQYVRVLDDVQDAIKKSSAVSSGSPGRILDSARDEVVISNPLCGEVDRHVGHGTFITGIIRQAAPDAQVAVARVLHSDGVAYESDVLAALWALVERVRAARAPGLQDQMVDILSLQLGYYDETPATRRYTTMIADVIHALTDLGVLVVASAGNESTSRPLFPAALAATQPVLSVGALNPDGTKALFSNEGSWVRAWATGASVVSTFPVDARGSWAPPQVVPALNRAQLDPDNFKSGFAVWHGTSFAAPLAAAHLANGLIQAAKENPKRLRLGDVTVGRMRDRAQQVVKQWTRTPDRSKS
jgi:hypothetical protein